MNKLPMLTPEEAHVNFIAGHLRASDLAELQALGVTSSTAQALAQCVKLSALCWVMLYQGEPVAITGVIPHEDDAGATYINSAGATYIKSAGAPWLVGTDKIARCPVRFMRSSHWAIAEYLKSFSYLHNIVDAWQVKSLRYLKALGFTLDPPRPFGNGTFHKFYLETK